MCAAALTKRVFRDDAPGAVRGGPPGGEAVAMVGGQEQEGRGASARKGRKESAWGQRHPRPVLSDEGRIRAAWEREERSGEQRRRQAARGHRRTGAAGWGRLVRLRTKRRDTSGRTWAQAAGVLLCLPLPARLRSRVALAGRRAPPPTAVLGRPAPRTVLRRADGPTSCFVCLLMPRALRRCALHAARCCCCTRHTLRVLWLVRQLLAAQGLTAP